MPFIALLVFGHAQFGFGQQWMGRAILLEHFSRSSAHEKEVAY